MNRSKNVLRALALVSSITLVAGFVAYSLGAFTFMSGSKSNPVFQMVQPKAPQGEPGPAPREVPTAAAKSETPAVLGGSKFRAPIFPPPKVVEDGRGEQPPAPKPAE